VSTAKSLHMTQGTEVTEFVVRAGGTKVEIAVETPLPQRSPPSTGRVRPETGLRQLQYLP